MFYFLLLLLLITNIIAQSYPFWLKKVQYLPLPDITDNDRARICDYINDRAHARIKNHNISFFCLLFRTFAPINVKYWHYESDILR